MTSPLDPDDLAYVGRNDPGAADVYDATPGTGRLVPLSARMDAYFAGPPLGFVQTGDAAAVTDMTRSIPAGALSATVQVQGGPIRYTVDGTNPTAGLGHRGDAGTIITLTGGATLRGFQWIRETATATTLAVTFWG